MAPVRPSEIYRKVVDLLKNDPSVDTQNVYLSYQPIFDPTMDTTIQVVPGAAQSSHPESGVGLLLEEFQVAMWHKVNLDRMKQSTERIAGETQGLLRYVESVRVILIQSWLDGLATTPVVLIQGSEAAESDDEPGYVQVVDTYRVGYEIAWEAQDP